MTTTRTPIALLPLSWLWLSWLWRVGILSYTAEEWVCPECSVGL